MMEYLLHSGLLLAACFLYYWVALRGETHFRLNRYVLLGCLVGSLLLPLITVPASWSLRDAPTTSVGRLPESAASGTVERMGVGDEAAASGTVGRMGVGDASIRSTAPATSSAGSRPTEEANWEKWLTYLWWVYLAGVLIFAANFLVQFVHLLVRMLRHPGHDLGEFRLVETNENEAPFSFWNRIFLNPDRYDPETFHQIVEHEQIHVRQRHSLDLLLAEAVVIFQWFNPFAWLYRRAIEHNLEYLTDAEMLSSGSDPETYQLSLVRVAVPNFPNGLVASYNQNFLEKRITMMKTKRSSLRSGWKYFSLPTLLLLSVLQFNAVAQNTYGPDGQSPTPIPPVAPVPPAGAAAVPGASAAPSPVPAPTTGVSAMPLPVPAPSAVPVPPVAPVTPASPELPPVVAGEINSWTARIEGSEICFQFMSRSNAYDNRYNYQNSRCFPIITFGALPRNEMGEFRLERTAGTMTFKGVFDGNDGVGSFSFSSNPSFSRRLRDAGYGSYEDREMLLLFMADINEDYLAFLAQQGYDPGHDQLLQLAIFYDDLSEVRTRLAELDRLGYDQPSAQKLIELQIHGVSEKYAEELARSGFEDLSLQDLIEARIHGLNADFLAALAESGLRFLDFQRAKEMAIHGVSADYVREMAALSYEDISARELVDAKIHGVSAQRIDEFRRAGLADLTLNEAKQMSIHGVDAELVAVLHEFGFPRLTPGDIVGVKVHGIKADDLRALRRTGLPIDKPSQLQNAAVHGVDARYIAAFRSMGYKDLRLEDYVKGKVHGVTPEFVASFREVGFRDVDFFTAIKMRIHGVSVDYIRHNEQEGYSLEDYMKMKINGRGSR